MKTFKKIYHEQMSAKDSIDDWKHDDAKAFAESLIKDYGQPDEVTQTMVKWYKLGAFGGDGTKEMETYVIDESIPHSFPDPHRDFVYTVMEIKVPSHMLDTLGHVTGSIVYDGLKKTVTARCGSLEANALTLQFVKDLVEGKIKNDNDVAKKEYANRIRNGPLPKTFTPEEIEGIINCGCNQEPCETYGDVDESPNPVRKFKVVTRAMRRKIAMRMRRMAKSATFKKKKEKSKRRIAPPEKILMKARKMAKQKILKKRFPRYSDLGVNQKIKVDQIIQQRYSGGIAKLAKKFIKVVRRKEIEKVKRARQGPETDDV